MKKTAIVIGGTGLVGTHLVASLVDAEHIKRIVVITRRPIKSESEKIVNHILNFDELDNNQHLFSGDILFSCLGTTAKQAGSLAAQRKVDLEYQYTAARLAYQQGVSHYLLVSSSGADQRSLSPYLKMKGELELKVRKLGFQHTSIIQPSLLLGDRDDSRIAESLGAKVLPILCKLPGLKRYRPIDGAQVAKKMATLSLNPENRFETISLDQVFSN